MYVIIFKAHEFVLMCHLQAPPLTSHPAIALMAIELS